MNFSKRLPTTIFLITFIIAILFYLPSYFFIMALMGIVLPAQYEFYQMLEKKKLKPFKKYGILAGFLILLVQYLVFENTIFAELDEALLITLVVIMIGLIMRVIFQFKKLSPIGSVVSTLAGIIYIPWLFCFAIKVRFFGDGMGSWYLIFVLLVTKSTDIFAYVVGSLIGKNKLALHISQNKTKEGAIGGIIGSLMIAFLFKIFFPEIYYHFSWLNIITIGLLLSGFSIIGDLFESSLKRDADIKDSGHIFPGMGGALDLIDSLILVSPIMYLYLSFI